MRKDNLCRKEFCKRAGFGLVGLILNESAFGYEKNSLGYRVFPVVFPNPDNTIEYTFWFNDGQLDRHFMSIIDQNQRGTFIFRPHPGEDKNGWGSSWYAQPFLPGAVLKYTNSLRITIQSDGILVNASGKVSRGTSQTYGNWTSNMKFSFVPKKRISGNGTYSIALDNFLGDSTRDLNLFKIASNYLMNVPLLGGGVGDTGDMKEADVKGDGFHFIWIPDKQPAHFPMDLTNNLSIDVKGQYNIVDSAAQGYAPIKPAYKPSLKVVLNKTFPSRNIPMIFGGIYDLSKAKHFWADNVGITPLILKSSREKEFRFNVYFESLPLPEFASVNRENWLRYN